MIGLRLMLCCPIIRMTELFVIMKLFVDKYHRIDII